MKREMKKANFIITGSLLLVFLVSIAGIVWYYRSPENYAHMIPTIIAILCLLSATQHKYWSSINGDIGARLDELSEKINDIQKLSSSIYEKKL